MITSSHRTGLEIWLLILLSLLPSATKAQAAQPNSPMIPHAVQGVAIKINDPLVKSISLSWKPNVKADRVDRYAVYLLDSNFPQYTRALVATTTRTRITLKTWSSLWVGEKQPQGTVFLDPQVKLKMFVIAHNKYGWGAAWPDSPYPNHEKPPALTKAQYQEYGPKVAYGIRSCTDKFVEYYSEKKYTITC